MIDNLPPLPDALPATFWQHSMYTPEQMREYAAQAVAQERARAEKAEAERDALADELREVLVWARVEKAPLRTQEVESIRRTLAANASKEQ